MTVLWFFVALALATLIATAPTEAADEGPPLELLTPVQNSKTNNTTLVVTGTTLPNVTVNVTIDSILGQRHYQCTPHSNGSFEVEVELFEGGQKVFVTVGDGTNNTTTVWRYISCDTEPCWIKIIQPAVSPTITDQPRCDIKVQQLCECPIRLWILGVEVWFPGIANRTVDLHEGVNRIDVRGLDGHGNWAVHWVTILADFTPPQLVVTEPLRNNILTNSTALHLVGNVTGASMVAVEHKARVLNATLVTGDWEVGGVWECDLELDPMDLHTCVIVRATGQVGHEDVRSINVTLDVVPPRLNIQRTLPERTEQSFIIVNGTTEIDIEVVDVFGVLYPVTEGEFKIVFQLEEGPNHIPFEVQDAAGNRRVDHVDIFYDNGPPKLDLDVPERTRSSKVHIKGTTDRNVEEVLIDGEAFPVVNGAFDVVVNLTKGKNTFKVEVEDPAGNVKSERVEVKYSTLGLGTLLLGIAIACAAVIAIIKRVKG
jgi:hypothetical protein